MIKALKKTTILFLFFFIHSHILSTSASESLNGECCSVRSACECPFRDVEIDNMVSFIPVLQVPPRSQGDDLEEEKNEAEMLLSRQQYSKQDKRIIQLIEQISAQKQPVLHPFLRKRLPVRNERLVERVSLKSAPSIVFYAHAHISNNLIPWGSWRIYTAEEQYFHKLPAPIQARSKPWVSPPNDNIYATFFYSWCEEQLKNKICNYRKFLPLVAVAKTLEEYGLTCAYKWPNDILVDNKKICGVGGYGETSYFVHHISPCYIGLNVNMGADICRTIDQPATSMYMQTGKVFNKEEVLKTLVFYLIQSENDVLEQLKRGGHSDIFSYLQERAAFIGQEVIITEKGSPKEEKYEGILKGFSPEGQLILLMNNTGEEKQIDYGSLELKSNDKLPLIQNTLEQSTSLTCLPPNDPDPDHPLVQSLLQGIDCIEEAQDQRQGELEGHQLSSETRENEGLDIKDNNLPVLPASSAILLRGTVGHNIKMVWKSYLNKNPVAKESLLGGSKKGNIFSSSVSKDSVWNLGPVTRGEKIESTLGHNLPKNFPVIDRWNETTGVATSIKSVDLRSKTYQNSKRLESTLKKYVHKVAEFRGGRLAKTDIQFDAINERVLDIAIPKGATFEQRYVIRQVVEYGKNLDVKVNSIIIK